MTMEEVYQRYLYHKQHNNYIFTLLYWCVLHIAR